MTQIDVTMAPGCYGMSMLYSEGSAECSTCPFATTCKPLGEQQLAMLRAELGIVVPVRKTVAVQPKPEIPQRILELTNGLPKKVAAWVYYIEKSGIKVTESLAQGRNPFQGKRPDFLNIACLLLLKCPQGVPRETMRYAFMSKLSWTPETATSHVTQTKQILGALGAADDLDGLLKMRAA